MTPSNRPLNGPPWRAPLYDILFEADNGAATAFDVCLILAILASVLVVMLDSVTTIVERHHQLLLVLEWVFTILLHHGVRGKTGGLSSRSGGYALSFFGIVDLFSIIPTYLSVLLPGAQFLVIIRVLRVLRVFRVLKLVRYLGEAQTLGRALAASRYRIAVFLITVLTLVVVLGSFMYLIEGADAGFTSIPVSRLLGRGHADDGRVRGHHPGHGGRTVPGRVDHAHGLRDDRRADGYRQRRVGPGRRTDGSRPGSADPCLLGVPQRRSRCRRPVLQEVRRDGGGGGGPMTDGKPPGSPDPGSPSISFVGRPRQDDRPPERVFCPGPAVHGRLREATDAGPQRSHHAGVGVRVEGASSRGGHGRG